MRQRKKRWPFLIDFAALMRQNRKWLVYYEIGADRKTFMETVNKNDFSRSFSFSKWLMDPKFCIRLDILQELSLISRCEQAWNSSRSIATQFEYHYSCHTSHANCLKIVLCQLLCVKCSVTPVVHEFQALFNSSKFRV